MSDWGDYNPDNFTGLPESDLGVRPETRMQFCLALCGVKAAYEALQTEDHFWAMSVPMRAVYTRLTARYPYFYLGTSPAPKSSASCSTAAFNPPASASSGPQNTQERSKLSAVYKRDRAQSTVPTVIHTSNRSAAARARSVVARAHSPELGAHLSGSNSDLSEFDGIYAPMGTAKRTTPQVPRKAATSTGEVWRVRARKSDQVPTAKRQKLHSGHGTSVFGHKKLSDFPPNYPQLVQLQETLLQNCDGFRDAFVMALHAYFSYEELKGALPTQVNRERLQVATALVRDFCQQRDQREPTISKLHAIFSQASKSVKP